MHPTFAQALKSYVVTVKVAQILVSFAQYEQFQPTACGTRRSVGLNSNYNCQTLRICQFE